MNVMQGTVAAPTTNGQTNVITLLDAVTGKSFNAKVILLWTTGQTATGVAAGASLSYGASDGTNQGWCGWAADDAAATKNVGKYQRTDACIGTITNGTPTVGGYAACSFGAGTATLTWTVAPASAAVVHYLALGGSGLRNVKVGNVSIPTGTIADVTVSGLGFTPTHLCVYTCRQVAATPNGGTVHGQLSVGWSDGATQWTELTSEPDGIATSTGARVHSTVTIVNNLNDTTTVGFDMVASGATFASGQFTLTMSNMPDAAAALAFYIAFDSAEIKIGVETKPVTNITKKTTLPWKPAAVHFVSAGFFGGASNTSGEGCMSFALGAMTANAQGSVWAGSDDAVATSATDKSHSTTVALTLLDPLAAAPTNVGLGARSSLDADGYTLSWSVTTANPTDFGYVAFRGDTGIVAPRRRNSLQHLLVR